MRMIFMRESPSWRLDWCCWLWCWWWWCWFDENFDKLDAWFDTAEKEMKERFFRGLCLTVWKFENFSTTHRFLCEIKFSNSDLKTFILIVSEALAKVLQIDFTLTIWVSAKNVKFPQCVFVCDWLLGLGENSWFWYHFQ